jgi:chromosome segregation ATPase
MVMKHAAAIAEACCKDFPACGVAVSAILANIDEEKVTPSSGNVFADIGFTAEDYAAALEEIDSLRAEKATWQKEALTVDAKLAECEDQRDGWQAKCQKLWDEQDKPFNDLLHANRKAAKLQIKLEKAREILRKIGDADLSEHMGGYVREVARATIKEIDNG